MHLKGKYVVFIRLQKRCHLKRHNSYAMGPMGSLVSAHTLIYLRCRIKRIFIVVCGCSRLWLVPSRLALPLTALPSLEDWQTAVFAGCMYIVGTVWLWYCWNCGFFYALQKDFCEHVRTGVIIAKKSETSSFDLVRVYQDKELVIMKGFVNSILYLQLS